jgi:hypothetical protein
MDTLSFRAMFIRQHSWNLIIYSMGLLITLFLGLRAKVKTAFSARVKNASRA